MSLHVDWMRSTLHVAGRAAAVAAFRAAAAGSGVIPWTLDLDQMEEDLFLSMAAADPAMAASGGAGRAISLGGARILARRLRDATAINQERALIRAQTDRTCPFDLHRLLPVPDLILALGPDDPVSRAWLASHWGTALALRHIRELPAAHDRRRHSMAELRIEFWSADWSPWAALRRLRQDFAELHFALRPDYGTPGA